MYKVLNTAQVRGIELALADQQGTSLYGLMEEAGGAIARHVRSLSGDGRVVVVAGPGNNGGDGWVAARELHSRGVHVHVCSAVEPTELKAEAATAAQYALGAGVSWSATGPADAAGHLADAAVIVDGLLGIGTRLPLSVELAAWTSLITASSAKVVAIDVPTGVDSDTGRVDERAVRADLTVTFIAPKIGLVTYPAAGQCGELVVETLGASASIIDEPAAPELWLREDYSAILPRAAADAHKNARGRVLVVAGSGRFPGAAILAVRGAMRAGAGYVTLAVPDPVVPIAQAHLLAAPVVGLPAGRTKAFSSHAASLAIDLAADYDAVVLGPGLTLADGAVSTARQMVSALTKPLVIDADALNALVDARHLLDDRQHASVITPHPGELSRLLGMSVADVQSDRLSSASKLASPTCAVVLKGAGTVVSGSGRSVVVNSGTPALATAGTGDVLAGMIGTFLAQGLDPVAAGSLAAYLHGRAGQAAARRLTEVCVTAEDVPDYISDAVAELLGEG